MDLPVVMAIMFIPILILLHTVAYFDGKQRNKPSIPVMPKLA